jgi:hypothetical protein
MAQIAAITLNTRGTANGASANTIVYNPVSPYLQPEKGYDTKARWEDLATNLGVYAGVHSVTWETRSARPGSDARKGRLRVDSPTLEVTSPSTATGIQPAPTKAFSALSVVEVTLPERMTLPQLQEHVARTQSAVALAIFKTWFETNENVS